MSDQNLYLVKTTDGTEFYVLAADQTTAAEMVSIEWDERNWLGDGVAKTITLIANQGQYKSRDISELLIQLDVPTEKDFKDGE